ncbi:OLC1v1012268C1 [Oldenlandia corymbosa var. corymbosa]|uniref:OLC1v1012268C1 n=1 Tax=Oldenlandia corymbosa var. corymbosa TaxID=529605 RepID=A0AAV1DVP9_OLDCO|nr:OLC1v1012268C1 [Oldenlandia corymbosa var. corymbosa]
MNMRLFSTLSRSLTVRRQRPALVLPAIPTPRETKQLSDVDDQQDLGEELHPPFPGLEELVFNVPGSNAILHSPLLLIQVTRLQCGGFIFAIRFNHAMADGIGLAQFKIALAEIARGSSAPSVSPVWMRELLIAQDPPRITSSVRHEIDFLPSIIRAQLPPEEDFVRKSFFFGKSEISALRASLPLYLRNKCSDFVVLTACLWRCRIFALQPDPDEEVSVYYTVNARSRFHPPLPIGYYGNALAISGEQTTAGELMKNPYYYAAELVMKSTVRIKEKRFESATDKLSPLGKLPKISLESAYMVSDLTRLGFDEVDFGWGKPVYAGPAAEPIPGISTFHISANNKHGEKGIVVPMSLPGFVMERLSEELKKVVSNSKP